MWDLAFDLEEPYSSSPSFLLTCSIAFLAILCCFYILAKFTPSHDPLLLWLESARHTLTCAITGGEDALEAKLLTEPDPPIIASNSHDIIINGRRLRTVHIAHELGARVPLIVFVHGLGGQAAQWEYQIEYFSQTTNVLAVDLVGCGKSQVVTDWSVYTTCSLVNDLATLLDTYYHHPCTIIVGHSYGCSLALALAANSVPHIDLGALILLNPKANCDPLETKSQSYLSYVPDVVIDYARHTDRRGGLHSKSVDRMVAAECGDDLRMRQLKWNLASRTSVWKRMVVGADLVGKDVVATIQCPVLLISGKEDKVCSPHDTHIIRSWLLQTDPPSLPSLSSPLPSQATSCLDVLDVPPVPPARPTTPIEEPHPHRVPVPYIIPAAAHQTMMEKPELVNPIITQFLIKDCGFDAVNPAWHVVNKLADENKWSLKNYEKWKRTPIISATTIGPSFLRAMKVMRQTDPDHSPSAFMIAHPEIGFILDISHELPPYRTSDFEASTIEYIKLSTVSKIPPSRDDVHNFIDIVNRSRMRRPDKQIVVHCHYGFNRTGFMICCYLIEELGISVSDSIKFFAEGRPPGIRHSYFKDELYMRYGLPGRDEEASE